MMRKLLLALSLTVPMFAQNAALVPIPGPFLDNSGRPLAFGKVYTCTAATSCPGNPLATYTDSTGTTQNANPVILDAAGFAQVWFGAGSYKVVLQTSLGVQVRTIDNVQNNGLVLSSKALLLNPPSNVSQTVAGPVSLGSYGVTAGAATIAGAITSCSENGMLVVGSSCYADINTALTAAGSTGWVLIPKTYAGTDSYVTAYKNVIDLRGSFFGVYQYIAPSRPITGYPLGNDLALDVDGPADLYFVHDDLGSTKTTTVTSVTAGTQTITLAASLGNNFSTNAGVYLGRETANEEICTLNSVVSATVLNLTCAKTHSGTTDVWQPGATVFKGGSGLTYITDTPSQLAGRSAPWRWGTSFNNVATWPINEADPFPYSAIRLSPVLTGMSGGQMPTNPADLIIRNSDASHCFRSQDSTGVAVLSVCDGSITPGTSIIPSNSGVYDLGSSAKPWHSAYIGSGGSTGTQILSNASSARTFVFPDANAKAVIAGSAVLGSGTSDAITLQGVTSGSICMLTPANLAAANGASGTFIPSTAANTINITHSAVAGMVYFVHCTY